MVQMDQLIQAYFTTRRNKRRSADSVRFELHWYRNILRLKEAIDTRSVRPTAYTFVTTKPRPREVFACDMATRVIHHYIDIRLRPLIESELTDRTFNNRIGYGPNEAINTLISDIYEASRGGTRDAWIIKMDLQGYFPNADQDIVYGQLRDLVERKYDGDDIEDLLYMIQVAVYSYPTRHCYRKSPLWCWEAIPCGKSLFSKPDGIGGAIGHLIWQNAMNYYLNDLDHAILEEWGLHYVRFVDDMVIVTDNKDACLSFVIPEVRRRLAEKNCRLHPSKFYCQHYTKGVEFIGAYIKRGRVYVNNRIVRNAINAVRRHNRRIRQSRVYTFTQSANSHLGIFKTRNGFNVARRYLAEVSPKWWEYCELDERNMKIVPKVSKIDYLSNKYHLKRKKKSWKTTMKSRSN